MELWAERTIAFPPEYPAYCIYFPTGFNLDFETLLLARLETFGESMGKNLLVASWNVGDPTYIQLATRIALKRRPAIILTDVADPTANSFMITINGDMIKDVKQIEEILPPMVDLLLQGEKKAALKLAVAAGRMKTLESLGEHVYNIMKNFKIQISAAGVTISPV